jgi:capsid protein
LGALPQLRAMSRDALRNMPLAKGGVATLRDNVVGTGLWPEPALDRDLLGLSDEAAEAWEAQAKTLVLQHLTSTGIDAARKQNFVGLQRQALVNTFASGDVFALRRAIDRRDETLATCYQLLEADRVATPMGELANDAVRDGVEHDENGEAVAVHVVDRHPGDSPYTRALGSAAAAWGSSALGVTKRFPVRTATAGAGRRGSCCTWRTSSAPSRRAACRRSRRSSCSSSSSRATRTASSRPRSSRRSSPSSSRATTTASGPRRSCRAR